jgi:hypothetical protein
MKRTLFAVALVAAAGAAAAQTVQPPLSSNANAGINSTINAGAAAPAGGEARLDNSAAVNSTLRGAQTGGGAQVYTNAQMPTPTSGPMNTGVGVTGSASMSSDLSIANAPATRLGGPAGTAQRRIEQDGYKNVQNLQKGADGLWHGTAMRGNTQVQVTVDRAGRVAAQ